MMLKCISNKGYEDILTLNKIYDGRKYGTYLDESEWYLISCDNNKLELIHRSRILDISEDRNKKIDSLICN